MDGYELEMTQVIRASDESEDEDDDREVRAVLKVQLEDAPPKFQRFTLQPGVNIIGRSSSCDIRIDITAVSKQHAQIELCKSDIIITDLGSRNGVKIGKRTLQPHVMYSLDYNKEFSMAGLKAWILHDKENDAGGDTDSDTCSESLLTAAEVAQDQAGAEAWAAVPETSAVACDSVEGPGNVASVLGPVTHGAVNTPTFDANACYSKTQSSGSFTLPEMPNLDYTQTGSSEDTEPCGVDGEAKSSNRIAEAAAPAMSMDGGSNVVLVNDQDAFLCAPTQGFPDDTREGKPGDASTLGGVGGAAAALQPYGDDTECSEESCQRRGEVASFEADEADPLNAPTQGFAEAAQPSADCIEHPEAHFAAHDEVTEAANDEIDRLNAPTQGFANDSIAMLDDAGEENGLNAANDEIDRLNAPTQGFANDSIALLDGAGEENRLNAATQPLADDAECSEAPCSNHDQAANAEIDETARLNAPTQGFGDDTAEDLNAVVLAPTACASLDEQERLNAVTQSIGDCTHNEADAEHDFSAPTQPGDRPRRLLSGPCDLSFVLCEASQPCRDDEEEEGDEEYCPATQKEVSPGLKVHALLKHGKEKRRALVDDNGDETPPLSPKTTVDETPPASPGFVAESDPEDNSLSMVTARYSLSVLESTSATFYEDCATPGDAVGSPVIGIFGRVSAKKRRSGMSLRKKPSCNVVVEQPIQEAAAGAEQQQESVPSKASRKLDYAQQAQLGDEGSGAAESSGTTTVMCLEKDAQDGSNSVADNTGCSLLPSPAKGRSSMASIDPSEKDDDAPYLHMSEIEGLDVPATEEDSTSGPCRRCATFEETEAATEGHVESVKVVDNSASPGSRKTPEQPCSHEEVPEKEESAEVSSEIEGETETTFKRNGKRKQAELKISRIKNKASRSDVGDATAEAPEAPARRSSGRQNAGSRMKSLLSLEKRTSASGNFREGGLSQEVSDKQDAVQDVVEKAQDDAVKRGSRRGQRGKGALKEKQEMAPLLPRQEFSPDTSLHEKDVEESLLKSGNREPLEEKTKCAQKSRSADEDEECVMGAPLVDSGNKHVEDKVEGPPSPLVESKLDCTYTTIETGFSEPFTSFSQILEECLPAAEDGKTEKVDSQKQAAADTAAVEEDEAASSCVHSELESVAERRHRASRSMENASSGIVTRKRKELVVKSSLPCRSTTRSSVRESSRQPAEVLVEDTPREVEGSGAVQPPAQQRSTRAANRGRLARNRAAKKAAPEFEVLSTIPETGQLEGGSEVDSLSAQPVEDVDEKSSEAPETSVPFHEEETVSGPHSPKTSRRGIKRTTKAARAGTDTAAGNTEEEEGKGATGSQPGRSTRTRPAHQDSELQNESTLDASIKMESVRSLSPRAPRRGRRGEKLSQERNSKAHTQDSHDTSTQSLSSELEPEAARGLRRRGRAGDAAAENTLADSCTDTESQDNKTSRRRGKAAALSQAKGDKTMVSMEANVAEESCAEHQLDETAGYRRGRKGIRLPAKKRGVPVTDTSPESTLESGNTEAEGYGALPLSGKKSARLSQKQHSEESSKIDVKESPRTPEPQTTRSTQRKRDSSLSQESKTLSEQTAAAGPAKRLVNTEPTNLVMNSQHSSESSQQGQSQETRRRGGRSTAKASSKAEHAESKLELSPEPTGEAPKTRPSRRQASKMPAAAQAPATRKRGARVGKQEGEALISAAPTVVALEEVSLLCSPPKAARRKRPVASMSFGETRQESDDDGTAGNDEETLEEMQIMSGPKSRRRAPVKEPAVKQEFIEEPPTKRGKRKGNLPDVIPVEPQSSRSKENAGTLSPSTTKTLKRKPKVLFTGIDCTNKEEQVVRELGGVVATSASVCTHLVTDKFRRTVKSLCCIGKGTPIVDVSWIKKCQETKAFVDHTPYLLKDKKAEKSLNFSLSEALAKAATHGGVLHGWSIHATAHVQPSPPDMKEIVTCAGGKYLDAMPTRSTTSGNTVIVSCKDDAKACARAKNSGVPVVSAEFVLSGLLLYKVDIEAHRLG